MSHAIQKSLIGRQPFAAVKLSLDYCTRTYGRDECSVGRVATNQLAQGGGANTITLNASDTYADNALLGFAVYISGGTGMGQEGRILSNDNGTKVAVVAENWAVVPDGTSIYTLIDRPNACFNTRANCQDTPNYAGSPTENEIWLTNSISDFPEDIWEEANLGVAVPCLKQKGISSTPPNIDVTGGLGQRASITANCFDFPHHDRGVDKYALYRTYNPEERGTFWGKFVARNLYYQGRELTYYDGYLVDGLFDITNFHERTYLIEKLEGPDAKGNVRILAKDAMKLADGNRSFAPLPTTGALALDLVVAETTSMTLVTGTGEEYGDSGFVRVNSEIIEFASRTGDVLETLTRQSWGTAIARHDVGDSVQLCLTYDDVNVVDIIYDLYVNYASIDPAIIPTTEWDAEKTSLLAANTLTANISEPMGVNELVKELVQENLIYMWWADHEKEIKLKAFAPVANAYELNDADNFLVDSVKVWHDPKQRVSQFWMYYGLRDYTDDGTDNFRFLYIQLDSDAESEDKYDDTRLRRVESRWIDESNSGLVIQLGGRTLALFAETPRMAKFRLDAKDEVETGDFVTVTTRLMQEADGSPVTLDMLIIEKRQVEQGSTYEYTAQEFIFVGRYGVIGPNDLPDYTADVVLQQDATDLLLETGDSIALEEALVLDGATSTQKAKYSWISPDSGFFADGTPAYKIL